jgi:hypothetical protein
MDTSMQSFCEGCPCPLEPFAPLHPCSFDEQRAQDLLLVSTIASAAAILSSMEAEAQRAACA